MQCAVRRKSGITEKRDVSCLRRGNDRAWEDLRFPAQTVVEREVVAYLPPVLRKQRVVLILNSGCSGRRNALYPCRRPILQIKKERPADACASRAGLRWSSTPSDCNSA